MPPTTIAYDRSGQGPTVVLLHPTGLGPAVLVPLAARLAPDHDVVIPHRRGYGRSVALDTPTSLDDHLDDLAAVVAEVAPSHAPVTLVGVSAGATICLAFARRFPDAGVRILAHEPLFGPLAPQLHARVSGRIQRLLARADEPLQLSLFTSELVGTATWNAMPAAWRDGVERNRMAALAEVGFYASFALDDADLGQIALTGLTTSVGARSGAARHEAAEVLRAHGLGVLVVPDCGHLASFDAPATFADTIRLVGGRDAPATLHDDRTSHPAATARDARSAR